MNTADARRLALDMPEAVEKSHFDKPDFRVRNHVFMTLPGEDRAVFKLMPEQQEVLAGAEPEIFAPVPGGWGRQGWTTMFLEHADEATLKSALVMAWRNVAPASLRKAFDGRGPATMAEAAPFASAAAWTLVAADYDETTRPYLEAFSRSAIERLRLAPDAEAIDVGCGPGTTGLLLAPNLRRVACVDFSEGMLDRLRLNVDRAGLSNIEPCRADGQALPHGDGSFDIAVSMFGLMFFPDRAKGFAELYRVLRRRGEAVVSSWAPADRSPLMQLACAALGGPPAEPPPATSGPEDPAVLEREMRQAGFVAIRVEAVSHTMTVTSIGTFWRGMARGVAPIALLRQQSSPDAWARIEAAAVQHIAAALPELPASLSSTAYLAIGRRP